MKTKTLIKDFRKGIVLSAVVASVTCAATANATEHTAGIDANGTHLTVDGGDIFTVNPSAGAYALRARANGSIAIDPSGQGITINYASAENPGTSSAYLVHANNGSINLGTGTAITSYHADDVSNAYNLYALNGGTITVNSGLIINQTGSAARAVMASTDSFIDLGVGASISVDYIGISTGGTGGVLAESATITSRNYTAVTGSPGSSITLINCDSMGYVYGASMQIGTTLEIAPPATVLNITGGTVRSQTNSAIAVNDNAKTLASSGIINISAGAKIYSGNGVAVDNESFITLSGGLLTINIEGADTEVNGRILDGINAVTDVNITNSAAWVSEGSSTMDSLTLDNANINFTFTATDDAITVGEMSTSGSSDVTINFSNDFLNDITDGFVFDTDDAIIVGSGEKDNINYIVLGQNKDGSTWDISDNGDGTYTITNINVVPEPATYAAIFGALALALAIYRRRK